MENFKWEYVFNWDLVVDSFPFVIQGLGYTLLLSLASMAIGLLLGLLIATGRMSANKLLHWIARFYISFMRGTPLLVWLFILYFGLPMVGIEFTPIAAAIIGISTHFAGYIAEVIRSAIMSIPKGQWEAAATLQMGYWQTMRKIILPQAARVALPPLSSLFIDIIKGTSLTAVITVPEVLYNAKVVAGRTYETMTMYILVALIYWAICSLGSVLQNYLEKKYSRHMK
ncbi:amino acid ABC transporter permease [Bacillus testis]|uniref:amino acid ABC transporter permease n=1 Tax=Bacillus testis TaxID=1622072 RepID=UPI00067EC4EB|nr:ABC transporter permease subunit [Bacillus testis]